MSHLVVVSARSRSSLRRRGAARVALLLATAAIALAAVATAQATDFPALAPGFNGTVRAISGPDANGTRYVGGDFTAVDQWASTYSGVLDADTVELRPSFATPSDGVVLSTASDGSGGWFIGGTFNHVGGQPRAHAAHLLADGSVDPAWHPDPDGWVWAIAVSGSTVYLGGVFSTAGGSSRVNAAAIGANGTALSWNPAPDYRVLAIAVVGSTVYLGGDFTNVDGTAQQNAAAVDATSGHLLSSLLPSTDGRVEAIGVSGSWVYLGGTFTSVGGQSHVAVARVSTTDGAVDAAWLPVIDGTSCAYGADVYSLSVTATAVYFSGCFADVGSDANVQLSAAAVNLTNGGVISDWYVTPSGNGSVSRIAVNGSTVYLGGTFTTINGEARTYAAAVGTDGSLKDWNPQLNDQVRALTTSGSDVYLGGDFTSLGGEQVNHVAAVTANGAVDPSWQPDPDDRVRAIAVSGSTVYLGGDFTYVDGELRKGAVAVSTDGALLDWNPQLTTAPGAPSPMVRAIVVDGSTVYLGGAFFHAYGLDRSNFAAVNATTAVPNGMHPDPDGQVHAIAVSGSTVYLGGDFAHVDGTSRLNAAAVDAGTGFATGWNPNLDGGTVDAMAIVGSTVYLGGGFTSAGPSPGVTRNHAAAVNAGDGSVAAWNPDFDSSVSALAVVGSTVYAGGGFTQVGGATTRNHAAAVDAGDGSVAAWNPNLNGDGLALAVGGSTVYVGGAFDSVGGAVQGRVAAVGVNGLLTSPRWGRVGTSDPVTPTPTPSSPTTSPATSPEPAAPAPFSPAPGITVGETRGEAILAPSVPAAGADLLRGANIWVRSTSRTEFVASALPAGLKLVNGKLVATKPGTYAVKIKVKRANGTTVTRKIKITVK